MTGKLAEMSSQPPSPDQVPAIPPQEFVMPSFDQCALLLDIDGTLLDLAPTPREVWVPPGLARTLNGLLARTSGAMAMVSGRSLNDIDLIFAPEVFPAVGGHGAEMRQMNVGTHFFARMAVGEPLRRSAH